MDEKELLDGIINGGAGLRLVTPDYWDGKVTKEPGSEGWRTFAISAVTTCMGRLGDIKQTLQKNIDDNVGLLGSANFEWLLLDYNSQDGLANWVEKEMKSYIDNHLLSFYRTEDPKAYSMAHSRNVCFRLARGEIINSVDADNLVNKGFFDKINLLANERPEKVVFAKGKRMLRGRLGFYKKEFIDLLGGYDEELGGYGHEDHDLLYRAFALGFRMMWFGGDHYQTVNPKKHDVSNFENKEWRFTEKRNKLMSYFNIFHKRFKANPWKEWGKAIVEKNFSGVKVCSI
jgi:hypothetical protein